MTLGGNKLPLAQPLVMGELSEGHEDTRKPASVFGGSQQPYRGDSGAG